MSYALFFFNDTATTEIYTLSLHDALPISLHARADLAAGHLAHLQPEGHVVEHRHLRVERVVLEDHGDVSVARRDALDRAVADPDAPARHALEPGEQPQGGGLRSEEHTSELQSRQYIVCRLLLEKKK